MAATLTLQSFAVPAFAADDYSAVEVEEVVQDEVVEESADEVAEDYVEPLIENEDTAIVFDDQEEAVFEEGDFVGEDFVEVEEAVEEEADEVAATINYEVEPNTDKVVEITWSQDLTTDKASEILNSDSSLNQVLANDGVTTLYKNTHYTAVAANAIEPGTHDVVFVSASGYNIINTSLKYKIVNPELTGEYTAIADESKFVYDGDELDVAEVVAATTVLDKNRKLIPYNGGTTTANEYSVVITPVVTGENGATAGQSLHVKIAVTTDVSDPTKDVVVFDKDVRILKKNIADSDVTIDVPIATYDVRYDGTEKKPTPNDLAGESGVEVKVNNAALPAALTKDDFTVTSWSNNINANKDLEDRTKWSVANVTIADSCTNYTGTGIITFKIRVFKGDISLAMLQRAEVTYTGYTQNPEVSIAARVGSTTTDLPKSDYKVIYPPTSINAGTYKVGIDRTENANGYYNLADSSVERLSNPANGVEAYDIKAAKISDVKITQYQDIPANANFSTTGGNANIFNYFTFELGDFEIQNAANHFTITDTVANRSVGQKGTIKLTGTGNLTGEVSLEIEYKALPFATSYTSSLKVPYTGGTIRPTETQLISGDGTTGLALTDPTETGVLPASGLTTLTFKLDTVLGDDINVGEKTAVIVGKDDYVNKKSNVLFKISPRDLSTITGDMPEFPGFTVSGARELELVVNFTTAGRYYTGEKLSGATVQIVDKKKSTTDPNYVYRTLVVGTDCEVYAKTIDSTNHLLKYVTVKGLGNYGGDKDLPLTPAVRSDLVSLTSDNGENVSIETNIPAGMGNYDVGTLAKYIKITVDGSVLASTQYSVSYATGVTALTPETATVGKTAGIVITGQNEISGSVPATIKIVQRDINDVLKGANGEIATDQFAIGSLSNSAYDGTEKKPGITINPLSGKDVKNNSLTLNKDYTVSYSDNVNAGKATVTVTGTGNYTGTASKQFTISKVEIDSAEIVDALSEKGSAESGKIEAVAPNATLREFKEGVPADLSDRIAFTYGGRNSGYVLTTDDYTVELLPNQNIKKSAVTSALPNSNVVVNYAVKINPNSTNYMAKYSSVRNQYFTVSYKLVKKMVTSAEVTIENNDFKVGDTLNVAKLGKVTVIVDGNTLTQGKDYTLGIEKVVINPTTKAETRADWSSGTIEDLENTRYELLVSFTPATQYVYTGAYRKKIGVEASNKFDINDVKIILPTTAGLVFDNTKKVVSSNYIGSLGSVAPTTWTYDQECDTSSPAPTNTYWSLKVYDQNGAEVTANDIKNAGIYTAKVKATEAYGGAEGESITFTIAKQELTKKAFEDSANKLSLGDTQFAGEETSKPEINKVAEALTPSYLNYSDFEVVEWDKAWDLTDNSATKGLGKAKIAIKKDSNFTYDGTYDKTFAWAPGEVDTLKDADDYSLVFATAPVTYNGTAQKPAVIPVEGSDADVVWVTSVNYYGDLTNAYTNTAYGTITVKIPETAGKYKAGTYAGIKVKVTINPASIESATVEPIANKVYTGEAIRPALSVKNSAGEQLAEGTDFTTTYTNNTEVGEATVTITGIQNYTGTKTATFNIIKSSYETAVDEALAAVKAAKAGSAEADKAMEALEKAIADAEIAKAAGVNVGDLDAAKKALTDAKVAKAEALADAAKANPTTESVKAAEDAIAAAQTAGADANALKKATETAAAAKEANITNLVKAAEDAAAKAAANATPENIAAAEAAIKAATEAGATAAQIKKASDQVTAAKGGGDRTQDQTAALLTSFTSASNAVPALAKVKDTDLEKVNTALAAYEKLSPAQKATSDVKKAKAALDAAKNKIMNPTITFKNKKVKAKGKNKLKVKKSLKLKARSNTKRKCTYESSNTKVATVNKNGKVKALKKGNCKITVKCRNTTKVVKIKVK